MEPSAVDGSRVCREVALPRVTAAESSEVHPQRALRVLICLGAVCTGAVGVIAWAMRVGFELWFPDTSILLAALMFSLLVLGAAWDATVLAFAWIRRSGQPFGSSRAETAQLRRTAPRRLWQEIGFLSLGPWPIYLVAVAAYFVLETSNITRISLHLIQGGADWRDPVLWSLEAPLFDWLQGVSISASAWDLLYHNAWTIELTVLFALILITRSPVSLLYFLVSFLLLFYVGRIAGLFNPVMGPAFFRPEHFLHLQGSLSETMMGLVGDVMAAPPEETTRSAVLLGGVSAMPSLHVGMVSLTAYWLAAHRRITLVVTLPWVLCVWTSTIVLGWHYALDGLGGIALAAGCIVVTRALLGRLEVRVEHAKG